jgi:hypothetical protein
LDYLSSSFQNVNIEDKHKNLKLAPFALMLNQSEYPISHWVVLPQMTMGSGVYASFQSSFQLPLQYRQFILLSNHPRLSLLKIASIIW